MTMSERARLLDEEILPAAIAQDIDEIILVGRYPEALESKWKDRITMLTLPPMRLDRIEAFREREVGARWSTGDILIVSADDHKLTPDFISTLRSIADEDWDLITPRRVHGQNLTTELNNGRADCYSPWHVQVYRRPLWVQVPFTTYDTLWVDIVLPKLYDKLGAKMVWHDELTVIDVEAGPDEDLQEWIDQIT